MVDASKIGKNKEKFFDRFKDDIEEESYEVTSKADWGRLVTDQCDRIGKLGAMVGNNDGSQLRTSVDILYAYISKDADRSKQFQERMDKLKQWKHIQLKDLPSMQRAVREKQIEYEYAMKKFQIILRLMDDKGYFGSKTV